jgi:hypothetical protein
MLNSNMALNGISTLELKRDRQLAKLELASAKRLAQGHVRPYFDITQLPTQYPETSNNNALVNNPNIGGLFTGRPWTSDPDVSINNIELENGDDLLLENGDFIALEN